MAIKFLLDRLQQEEEKTVANILEVIKKKPYPNKETEHLATFMHALFRVGLKQKSFTITAIKPVMPSFQPPPKEQLVTKEVVKYVKKPLPMPPHPFRAAASNLLPEQLKHLQVEEIPSAPTSSQRMEYTVLSFDTPIGIISEPISSNNKPSYTVIEPQININLLSKLKEIVAKDVTKDYKILDEPKYLRDKIEKAAKKADVAFSEDLIPSLKYFLKRDLTGFRKLDTFMQDLNVKAIYVDGINKPIVVETSQYQRGQSNLAFNDAEDLNTLIKKLAKATSNEISEEKPILDTVFQGFKIQAVLGIGNAASKLIIKKVI